MKRYLIPLLLLTACNDSSITLPLHIPNNGIYNTAMEFSDSKSWWYDAAYYAIPYPNGDVPTGGACTDVVIRVLRENGIDLQKAVHEDMLENFNEYPNLWGLSKPDPNIDHRRVPNLMTYFKRKGYDVGNEDFEPGDIVCWDLGGLTHIGIYLQDETVYHNMGPRAMIEEQFLYKYEIIGHYRIFNP